jgi:hypothetical protein
MARNYGYSYEIYNLAPAQYEPAPRICYEDNFTTRAYATMAMKEVMARADIPVGSTAFVCRRYDCGEMTDQRNYVKKFEVVEL